MWKYYLFSIHIPLSILNINRVSLELFMDSPVFDYDYSFVLRRSTC